MPEDQLLTAPGRDKEKIIVATSVGDGVVERELLFIMIDGCGGG